MSKRQKLAFNTDGNVVGFSFIEGDLEIIEYLLGILGYEQNKNIMNVAWYKRYENYDIIAIANNKFHSTRNCEYILQILEDIN